MNQSFDTAEPLRIGAGGGPENRFQGQIHDVRVYKVALTPEEAAVAATDTPIPAIAQIPADKRTRAQSDKITLYFLERDAPPRIQSAWKHLTELRIQRQRFIEALPTVMVMQERPTPRDTFVLLRGAYDRPGEKVSPGVPAVLPPLPAGSPNNRLGFAKWLVDPSNPLTARVIVNRFWQMYFGVGLVKTVEDFGSQGEWPTNLELLDWLATEFIRTRLGRQGDAEDDRDERDLPPVLQGHAGASAARSGESPPGARAACPSVGGDASVIRRSPCRGCWWKRSAARP